MIKKAILLISMWCLMLTMAAPILAAPVDINGDGLTQAVGDASGFNTVGITGTTLSEQVGRVIKIILSMVGVIFLVLTVYAGILWMTAAGNGEQVEQAQNIVKTASIGLLVVISSYGIVVFALAAVGAVTNTQSTGVGNMAPVKGNFFTNFGQNMKNNWWRYIIY